MRAEASARKPAGPETFLAPPPFDEVVPVEPGIHWLRVRLPFALDHVNLWLLEDSDGWTIIDTGVANDATRAVWEGVLGGFLGGRRVARVLITHFHPDHFGLATWLAERTGAPVLMSRTEWLTGRMLCLDDTAEALAAIDEHYRKSGMSEELRAAQRRRGSTFRRGVPSTPAVHLVLEAGQELTLAGSRWRLIIGEGHAPEQVTLFSPERRLLIAADQILPRISPVVASGPARPTPTPWASSCARSTATATCRTTPASCPRTTRRSATCTRGWTASRRTTRSGCRWRWRPAASRRPRRRCWAGSSPAPATTPTRPASRWPRRWRT